MATLHASRDPREGEAFFGFADPAIKLFGRTIVLPSISSATAAPCTQDESKFDSDEDCLSPRRVDELGTASGNSTGSDEEDLSSPSLSKGSAIDEAAMVGAGDVGETGKSSSGVAEDRRLRKPDQVAPCPRCSSLDTKFCYFNNYNSNQPRHFCKCCQRYWTDGGTLRNVPVGAGRRKNKHGGQQKQPLPDAVFLRREDRDGAQPLLPCSVPGWRSGAAKPVCSAPVLQFPPSHESVYITEPSPTPNVVFGAGAVGGQSLPTCDSCRVVDAEADARSGGPLQLHPKSLTDSSDITDATMATARDGKDDCACSSSTSASERALNSDCGGGISAKLSPDCKTAFPSLPVFGLPWPYAYMSWAGAGGNCATAGDRSSQMAYTNASRMNIPADCLWQWPHFPGPIWSPSGCCMPWTLPVAMPAAPAAAAAAAAKTNSSPWTLPVAMAAAPAAADVAKANNISGKRPRASSEGIGKGSLCIPKTLRIQDPGEAAQSSILATLGVDGRSGSLASRGIFSAFQPKPEGFQPRLSDEGQRHANPAAPSRFIAFHEGTKQQKMLSFLFLNILGLLSKAAEVAEMVVSFSGSPSNDNLSLQQTPNSKKSYAFSVPQHPWIALKNRRKISCRDGG